MHYGYILRGTVTGLYKIGIAGNALRRFAQYKTHVPERIVMESVKTFLSLEEARDWERWILHIHRDAIEHGEWLRLNFDDMAQIWAMGMPAELSPGGLPGCNRLVMTQQDMEDGTYLVRVFSCEPEIAADWHYCVSEQGFRNFDFHPRLIDANYVAPQKQKTDEFKRKLWAAQNQ